MADTQLQLMARRLPQQFIGTNGRNMDAMDHTVVTQLLLRYLGPYSFVVEREIYGGAKPKQGKGEDGPEILTGVVGRLTVVIDGREVSVAEPGGIENPGNQDGNGERAKHAASDSLKRCAMRLGLGLHLWSQDMYFLDVKLKEDAEAGNA